MPVDYFLEWLRVKVYVTFEFPKPDEVVLQEFLPGWSLVLVVGQTSIYEPKTFLRYHYVLRKLYDNAMVLFSKLVLVLSLLEGRESCEKLKQNSTQ